MSKKFGDFPNGNPPQNSDKFLLSRGGNNYTITWAQIVAALSTPAASGYLLQEDGIGHILLEDGSGAILLEG